MVYESRFWHLNIHKFTTLMLMIFKIEAINYVILPENLILCWSSDTPLQLWWMLFLCALWWFLPGLSLCRCWLDLELGRMHMRNLPTRRWLYDCERLRLQIDSEDNEEVCELSHQSQFARLTTTQTSINCSDGTLNRHGNRESKESLDFQASPSVL